MNLQLCSQKPVSLCENQRLFWDLSYSFAPPTFEEQQMHYDVKPGGDKYGEAG